MTTNELVEMARIAFVLPYKERSSIDEVLKEAKVKYGESAQEYRHGLEAIVLSYLKPRAENNDT